MSFLYRLGLGLRTFLYRARVFQIQHAPLPIISVGGLEAGGTGKTPIALLLLAKLFADGRRPGLLTRGYGRSTTGLQCNDPSALASAHAIGDEAAAMCRVIPGLNVAACANRWLGACALIHRGCDVLVMDDGFSHLGLARQLNIVVLRGEAPFDNGHLLPWGHLREPPEALGRADLVWLHYRQMTGHEIASKDLVLPRPWSGRRPDIVSWSRPRAAQDKWGQKVVLKGRRVVAAAATARPHEVHGAVAARGAVVVDRHAFVDHHRFVQADATLLCRRAKELRADGIVVTRKDAVKLEQLRFDTPVWTVDYEVLIVHGHSALDTKLIEVGASSKPCVRGEDVGFRASNQSDAEAPVDRATFAK